MCKSCQCFAPPFLSFQPVPAAQLTPLQNDVAAAAKKPWYKFWGGKKSKRMRSHKKRKYSRKHRK